MFTCCNTPPDVKRLCARKDEPGPARRARSSSRPGASQTRAAACGVIRTRNSARMMPCIAHEPEIWAPRREGGELHPDFLGRDQGAQTWLRRMLGELGLIAIDRERNRRGGIKSFSALSSHTPPSLVRRPRAGRARWSCSSSSEPSSAHTGCARASRPCSTESSPGRSRAASCCPCAYRRPRHRATTALFLGGSRYVRVSLYGIVARETLLLPRIKACATHGRRARGLG